MHLINMPAIYVLLMVHMTRKRHVLREIYIFSQYIHNNFVF